MSIDRVRQREGQGTEQLRESNVFEIPEPKHKYKHTEDRHYKRHVIVN